MASSGPAEPAYERFASLVSECRAELERQRAEMRITGFGRQLSDPAVSSPEPGAEKLREMEVLIAAAERMTGIADRIGMFQAIQEVLANLLGTESFAVFEKLDRQLHRVAFSGDGTEIPTIVAYSHIKLMSSPDDVTPPLFAPLMFGDAIVGVLAIYSFLPQKHESWAGDSALLRFVRKVAAAGLAAFPPSGCADEVSRGA